METIKISNQKPKDKNKFITYLVKGVPALVIGVPLALCYGFLLGLIQGITQVKNMWVWVHTVDKATFQKRLNELKNYGKRK